MPICPMCKKDTIDMYMGGQFGQYKCKNCGYIGPIFLEKTRKLIIFDLDQTLIDILPIHDKALEKAFKEVFGTKARFEETDFAGKDIRQNLVEIARKKKVKNINKNNINLVIKKYKHYFKKIVPNDLTRYLLPGIKRLIPALKPNKLAVMTGSAKGVPQMILKRAKLLKYFDAIISGTEAKDKKQMIKILIRRTDGFKGKDIVVIGDATREVEAGKSVGATTIAVHTGPHTVAMLKKAKPDYLLNNLKNYKKVLSIINKT